MTPVVVFVHGAGGEGPDAWPRQQALDGPFELRFVFRAGFAPGEQPQRTDFTEDRERVIRALGQSGHLVAHSYGALAALAAAVSAPNRVLSITLFEPACFSLARGGPEVEAHVAAIQPVFDRAEELTDEGFEMEFLAALGAPRPEATQDPGAKLFARRMRLTRAPWVLAIDPAVIGSHPTLVVTGDWLPLYEEVASVLEGLGARHSVVRGFGHRPQYSEATNSMLLQFWAESSR